MQRITYLNIIQTKVAAPTKIGSFELFFQLIRCKVLLRMRHCYSKYSIIIDQFLRFNDWSSKLSWSLAFIWYDSTVYTFYMVNHGAIMATFSDDSNTVTTKLNKTDIHWNNSFSEKDSVGGWTKTIWTETIF